MRTPVRSLVLIALLLLAACSSSRYHLAHDRAPSAPVDVSTLQEPVPVYEAHSRQGNRSTYSVFGKQYRVMDSREGFVEEGIASWYGSKFHGYHTANGEIYDMYQFTAAHKHLPLPTYVRVRNLDNNREVIVRVNDRGPFHGNRIIDLSYAAAARLGMLQSGTANVRVENVTPAAPTANQVAVLEQGTAPVSSATADTPPPATAAILQVGAYASEDVALRIRDRVASLVGVPVYVERIEVNGAGVHRVRVGPIDNEQQVYALLAQLQTGAFPDSFRVTP